MLRSIQEISESVRQKQISPVELTRQCLDRIERLNPLLNAFITVTAETALRDAKAAEEEIVTGHWRGPIHGIPIGLKDILDTENVKTTAASQLFKDRIPTKDAEVVRRLKSAGAILVGKQNMHEFAYGGSSMISYFGEVRNPWNQAHIAGGSSGGSASAVAAGLCYASIGTDTAGSIREPASQCGIVGIKATYGLVSAHGVFPLSVSLDHVGPLTLTVADAAIMLEAIAGRSYKISEDSMKRGFRIGVPRKLFFEALDPEVEKAIEVAISVLKDLGGSIRELALDVPTDRTLQTAESYQIHAENVARSPGMYQAETLRRIRSGEGISDEEIVTKKRALQRIRQEISKVFEGVDVLVAPTTPIPAPSIEYLKDKPEELRPKEIVLLRNTRPFNVWGIPAVSVPCGFTRSGLPIGLQIAGPHSGEQTILNIAHGYELATEWHKATPVLL